MRRRQVKLQTLRDDEQAVFSASGELMNQFGRLQPVHEGDLDDVVFHIHAIQNIILSRAAFHPVDRMTQAEILEEDKDGP